MRLGSSAKVPWLTIQGYGSWVKVSRYICDKCPVFEFLDQSSSVKVPALKSLIATAKYCGLF